MFRRFAAMLLLMGMPLSAFAQYAGFPLVDTAEVRQPGQIYASTGAALLDDGMRSETQEASRSPSRCSPSAALRSTQLAPRQGSRGSRVI